MWPIHVRVGGMTRHDPAANRFRILHGILLDPAGLVAWRDDVAWYGDKRFTDSGFSHEAIGH